MNREDLMDVINIMSFILGMENLEENIGQSDMDDILAKANKTISNAVLELHQHLTIQDEKLNLILTRLEIDYERNKEII